MGAMIEKIQSLVRPPDTKKPNHCLDREFWKYGGVSFLRHVLRKNGSKEKQGALEKHSLPFSPQHRLSLNRLLSSRACLRFAG